MSDEINHNLPDGDELLIDPGDEDVGDPAKALDKARKLGAELVSCHSERKEYLEGWQRARADFANYKKDQERLLGELKKLAEATVLGEILPIADGFEQAFSHQELLEQMPTALRTGFEQLQKELEKLLAKHELERYGEVGNTFDPALHSAVASENTDDEEKDHTIAQLHKHGYRQGKHIVRPALVAVFMKQ